MAAPYKLIQQLLRSATEDESFTVIADKSAVYATLRTLQETLRGICEEGRVLTESEVAGSRFRYALTGGGRGPEEWLILVERAVQIVESCDTVAEIRAYLVTHKRTFTDFSLLTH
jgi:hypothetical protein